MVNYEGPQKRSRGDKRAQEYIEARQRRMYRHQLDGHSVRQIVYEHSAREGSQHPHCLARLGPSKKLDGGGLDPRPRSNAGPHPNHAPPRRPCRDEKGPLSSRRASFGFPGPRFRRKHTRTGIGPSAITKYPSRTQSSYRPTTTKAR